MLLRFTTTDMLNTALIDIASGARVYSITTVQEETVESNIASQKKESSTCAEDVSSAPPSRCKRRRTTITDSSERSVASMIWNGRHPDITIGEEHVGGLTDLFGSSTVRFMPKILAIPTRFDSEYIWTATSESLTLVDYDSDTIKGIFHLNAVPVPQALRWLPKPKSRPAISDESPSPASSTSRHSLASTSSSSLSSPNSSKPLIYPGAPGFGWNYLEFVPHPLAHDVEIIISFIMMEILRRGRFSLTPYTFQRPKLSRFREVRDAISRRLRPITH
ncbi:hypothetical protein AX15_001221 [Amanita polypyramis BW_CC]|nr:hypothetical protein AX15_001221 [Amanita polypyramis BW_CC]